MELNTLASRDKGGQGSLIAIKIDMVGNKNRRHKNSLYSYFLPWWMESCDHVTLESLQSWWSGRCRKWTNNVPGSKSVTGFLSCLVPQGPYPEESGNTRRPPWRLFSSIWTDKIANPCSTTMWPEPLTSLKAVQKHGRAATSLRGPNWGAGWEESVTGDSSWQGFTLCSFIIAWSVRVFIFRSTRERYKWILSPCPRSWHLQFTS